MIRKSLPALALAFSFAAASAQAAERSADELAFRELYKELVETNTTLSSGSCTIASQQIADRLTGAGMASENVQVMVHPDHPKEGNLFAVIPGSDASLEPVLLLAHIDVVEAKREDWVRDPFTLHEEDGFFWARGSSDDKSMAAIWADMFVNFTKDGYAPSRTIKMALTCGEETDTAFNGANWLAREHRDLVDAAFVINEGGSGRTDGTVDADGVGNVVVQNVQVGEKLYQDYRLTVINPGGHSSQPKRDNAIYQMAAALQKIGAHTFPAELNDTTRAYFSGVGATRDDAIGKAMLAVVADPTNADAIAVLDEDKMYRSMLRTSCVATMIDGGHAVNALPQSVIANVNCRIFPGHTPAGIMEELTAIMDEPAVSIAMAREDKPIAKAPPLDRRVLDPMRAVIAKYYPGVPLIPTMSTGATDGLYFSAVGIPAYGFSGLYFDPEGNGAHGLDEHISVDALYRGRKVLTDLVHAYAD